MILIAGCRQAVLQVFRVKQLDETLPKSVTLKRDLVRHGHVTLNIGPFLFPISADVPWRTELVVETGADHRACHHPSRLLVDTSTLMT